MGETNDTRKIHAVAWETITKPKQCGGVGLRDLNVLNDVCLMKLAWKLYTNSNNLWCTVMKKKYNISEAADCLKVRAMDSSLWKSIAGTIQTMLETGKWILGDGSTINALDDNWLGTDFIVSNMDVHIPRDLSRAKVCDLVNEEGEWNMSVLNHWLPDQWLDTLRACLPPCHGQATDCVYFAGTGSGNFSIKAMYNELAGCLEPVEDRDWMQIWKAAVRERCKSFAWLLKHDRIRTLVRVEKGLGVLVASYVGIIARLLFTWFAIVQSVSKFGNQVLL